MARRRDKKLSSTPPSDERYWRVAVGLVLVTVLVVSGAFYYFWRVGYNSDIAMCGLFSKAVVERGDRSIFLWETGYQGAYAELYPLALLFALVGAGPHTLSLCNMLFFWFLLWVFYQHVAACFDRATALLGVLALTVSAPFFYMYVMRPQPNYTVTYMFGLAIFMLARQLVRHFFVDRKSSDRRTDLTWLLLGLVFGFARYTYGQIEYFALALGPYLAVLYLRDKLEPAPTKSPVTGHPWRKVPWIIWSAGAIPVCLGLFAFLTDKLVVPFLPGGLDAIKGMFVGVGLIVIGAAIDIAMRHPGHILTVLRGTALAIAGYVAGYAPALYYRFVQHGAKREKMALVGTLRDSLDRLNIFVHGIGELWSAPADFTAVFVIGVMCIACATLSVVTVRDTWRWVKGHGERELVMRLTPVIFLPWVVLPAFALARIVEDFWSMRYTLLLWLFYALALAFTSMYCWRRGGTYRRSAVVCLTLLLINNLHHMAEAIIEKEASGFDGEAFIPILRERHITAGFAYYWFAYSIDYFTNEEIKLDPLNDAHSPYYRAEILAQDRIGILDHIPSRISLEVGRIVQLGTGLFRVDDTWHNDKGVLYVLNRVRR